VKKVAEAFLKKGSGGHLRREEERGPPKASLVRGL
jgi:hypothetical protein